MNRNAVEHLVVRKFTGGWHVWECGGRIPSRWLSAHSSQPAAFAWAERYVQEHWDRLAEIRKYVDDPGNWSALDGRRKALLDLIDGGVA